MCMLHVTVYMYVFVIYVYVYNVYIYTRIYVYIIIICVYCTYTIHIHDIICMYMYMIVYNRIICTIIKHQTSGIQSTCGCPVVGHSFHASHVWVAGDWVNLGHVLPGFLWKCTNNPNLWPFFFWEHGKKMELVDLEVSYGGFKQTHQIFFGGWAPTR